MVLMRSSSTRSPEDVSDGEVVSTKRPLDFQALYDDNAVLVNGSQTSSKAPSLMRVPSRGDLVSPEDSSHDLDEEIDSIEGSDSLLTEVRSANESQQCVTTKFNCTTPYRYNNMEYTDRVILLSEFRSFKMDFLNKMANSESSDEEIRGNIEEHLIKRYIQKTVTGWDERGMHYWLHKTTKSDVLWPNISHEITGDDDSWFHIHVCEKCIHRLNISQHFRVAGASDSLSDVDDESFLAEMSLCDDDSCVYRESGENAGRTDELNDPVDSPDVASRSTDQYFRRVVYCYNTCGLNFRLLNDKEEKRKRRKGAIENPEPINPYVKVVVYGTDPCGLNFPIDLCGKEQQSKDAIGGASRPDESDESLACSSGVAVYSTPKRSRIETERATPYDTYDSVSSGASTTTWISSNTSSVLSSPNLSSTTPNSTDEEVSTGVIETHRATSSRKNPKDPETEIYTLYSQSLRFFQTTPFSSTRALNSRTDLSCMNSGHDTDKSNATLSSVGQVSYSMSSDANLFHMNSVHKKCVCRSSRGKSVISVSNASSSTHKARVLSLRRDRVNKHKQRTPMFMHFPDNASMKIGMIYFGRHCNKIFLHSLDRMSRIAAATDVSRSDKYRMPFCMRTLIYLSLVSFFILSYLLIDDSFRYQPVPEPVRRWYEFY